MKLSYVVWLIRNGIIGGKGFIIKAIQRLYGNVDVKPLPFGEDSHYIYMTEFAYKDGNKISVIKADEWFRIKSNKSTSGMYETIVGTKTGEIYYRDEILISESTAEIKKLGGVIYNPILAEAKLEEGMYIREKKFSYTICCKKKHIDIVDFFGYNKDDFWLYSVKEHINRAIQDFYKAVDANRGFEEPPKNKVYILICKDLDQKIDYLDRKIVKVEELVGLWREKQVTSEDEKLIIQKEVTSRIEA